MFKRSGLLINVKDGLGIIGDEWKNLNPVISRKLGVPSSAKKKKKLVFIVKKDIENSTNYMGELMGPKLLKGFICRFAVKWRREVSIK